MKQDDSIQNSKFQKFGLLLAAAFFVLSVIMVIRNHGGMSVVFSPDTKVITFAHWQLEDGFREGFDAAIKIYEKEKAEQGVKVKVRQVAVPVRGYAQWYLTQLIGGTPATHAIGRDLFGRDHRQFGHSQPVLHSAVSLHRGAKPLEQGDAA